MLPGVAGAEGGGTAGTGAGPAGERARVVLVLGSSAGGVGRHVHALVGALRADGSVAVAAPAATLERFAFAAAGALTAPVEVGASLHPLRDARAAARLRALLRRARPQVVHAHGVRAGLVALLAVRSLPRRPALVVTLHNAVLGSGRRAALGRAVQRRVAAGADAVLGVSGDLVAQARAAGAAAAERALVPAPPTAPAREPARVREREGLGEALVVLAVARLAPQKGLDDLLTAAASLPARVGGRDVVVLLAGDGPLRAALERRVAAERLPVRLLGARADVPDLLGAADVVVSASVWEGQPVFLQEALRAGAAVVATDAGGTGEVTGAAADLVPVGDPPALAAALRRLLADDALRAERGAAARVRAAQLPTAEDAAAQVRAVHARAVAHRRARVG